MSDQSDNQNNSESTSTGSHFFSRRSYIRATGATGLLFATGTATAQTDSYETITVPRNEQYLVTLGDNETFENKIIDISNSGATYRIEAYGSDWTIRNVGVRGVWDVASDGHMQSISCRVDSGTGTIENFYFADGVDDDTFPGVTGIYVQKAHSGTLNIKNVNIQNCPNNGVYGSNPGKTDGGKGVVNVEDSYFSDNLASSVRLGTDGSTARNCVINGGPHRGFWVYFESVTFENCDAIATNPYDAGGTSYDYQSSAYGELVNSRGEGTIRERGGGEIVGTMNPDPRTSPPSGVPTSPEEAASGGGTGSDDGGDTTTDSELIIDTAQSLEGMAYELTIDGTVTGGSSIEDDDTITESDGVTTVTGEVGWGYHDTFTFDGTVTDWSADADSSEYTLTLDGTELDPDQFVSESTLEIGTAQENQGMAYELVIDGTITGGSSIEDDDTITESDGVTTVTGEVGWGYHDTFTFEGSVMDWTADTDSTQYTLTLDDTELDPRQYFDERTLAITTTSDNQGMEYELTIDGVVSAESSIEDNDTWTESDGVTTVTGMVGWGYHDTYLVEGPITDWTADTDSSQYSLVVDGAEIDPSQL